MAGVGGRPNLLMLCQTLPYPPDGGVWIRTYHVIRLLARAFDITALCFERAGPVGPQSPGTPAIDATSEATAGVPALSRLANVEVFRLPQRHSRRRFVWDHARSLATRRVYTTYLYESGDFRRRLAHHLNTGSFDLVHLDSLDLARYLPGVPRPGHRLRAPRHRIRPARTARCRRAESREACLPRAAVRPDAGRRAPVGSARVPQRGLLRARSRTPEGAGAGCARRRRAERGRCRSNSGRMQERRDAGVAFVGGTSPVAESRRAALLLPSRSCPISGRPEHVRARAGSEERHPNSRITTASITRSS